MQAKRLLLLPALALGLSLSTPAQADVKQIDGNLWVKSSTAEKQAYLIGLSNTLSVYNEVQRRKGAVDESSPLTRYLRATDATTIRSIQDVLDRWYKDNPSRMNTPVLGVIWMGLVQRSR
ncbi:hypothetical protein GRI89_17570 [Altererythrobacter salegens]|uniref:Uncharacterized protein n=1 Tax=Croceibacterium salegens TaxID=1737568 RepID=A0A6I4SZ81_9SPHN|nr:hypothetical protein [Croceibacterium salegens]MXO61355.1 hypothetical protein [Croceibacterium salegens]